MILTALKSTTGVVIMSLTSIAAVTLSILLATGAVSCNGGKNVRVDETKNKTTENITANCWRFVMYAAEKGRWHEASNAVCLCQQVPQSVASQNLCKNSVGLVNYRGALDLCLYAATDKVVEVDGKKVTIKAPQSFADCMKNAKPGWD